MTNIIRLRPGYSQGYGNITKGRFVKSNREIKFSITKFLKCYAPDFCFCTSMDLYSMCEVLDEDVDHRIFHVTLSKLKRAGYFEVKKDNKQFARQGPTCNLYRRIK